MFVAIYRWRVKPGMEDRFRRAWVRGTEIIRENCDAGGSRLHKDADGLYVAYARWPSQAVRDLCFDDLPQEARDAIADMQDCVMETLPEMRLTITDDLLTPEADLGAEFHGD